MPKPAKFIDFPVAINSRNWDSNPHEDLVVGELAGAKRTYDKGIAPPRMTSTTYCGTQEMLQHGASILDPPLGTDGSGVPQCCRPLGLGTLRVKGPVGIVGIPTVRCTWVSVDCPVPVPCTIICTVQATGGSACLDGQRVPMSYRVDAAGTGAPGWVGRANTATCSDGTGGTIVLLSTIVGLTCLQSCRNNYHSLVQQTLQCGPPFHAQFACPGSCCYGGGITLIFDGATLATTARVLASDNIVAWRHNVPATGNIDVASGNMVVTSANVSAVGHLRVASSNTVHQSQTIATTGHLQVVGLNTVAGSSAYSVPAVGNLHVSGTNVTSHAANVPAMGNCKVSGPNVTSYSANVSAVGNCKVSGLNTKTWQGIKRIQAATSAFNSTSISPSWTSTTVAGHSLVAVLAHASTITYSAHPTGWAQQGTTANGISIWSAVGAAAQSGAMVWQWSPSRKTVAVMAEYSGIATTSTQDGANIVHATTTASGAITTTNAVDLLLCGFSTDDGGTVDTFGAGPGWTLIGQANQNGGSPLGTGRAACVVERFVLSAGTYTATATDSQASSNFSTTLFAWCAATTTV